MNILHLSFLDNQGGSGRAAWRIHEGLRSLGVESRMLVGRRKTAEPNVDLISQGRYQAYDALAGAVTRRLALEYLYIPSSFALRNHPWFREADVVQVYNTHGEYFSHSAFPALSRERPIVWRLSDMWAFTGHCAYSFECERWRTGCGRCPHLDNPWPLAFDTTALLWKAKRAIYARSKLHMVAPSSWIERCVRESPLLGHLPVHRIPNGIDTRLFQPVPRAMARATLGLDAQRPMILFAADAVDQARKGVPHFLEALGRLTPERQREIVVLTVGAGSPRVNFPVGIETIHFGPIKQDRLLTAIYSAADALALTTLADNLPNVLLESMACGTPAIAFDTGGVSDAVRDGQTGWLVPLRSAEAFAHAMEKMISDREMRLKLGEGARALIESEHTEERQARRFHDLYQGILAEQSHRAA